MNYTFLEEISKINPRINKIKDVLLSTLPEIESERAMIITNVYKKTEDMPNVLRRAMAISEILSKMPIVIRENELIVGNFTKKPRAVQIFPEFSNQWLVDEFDRINDRKGDVYHISDSVKSELLESFKYWKGKTVNELATSYMSEETLLAMKANVFTVNNYYFNGIGHIGVDYEKVLTKGFNGIIHEAYESIKNLDLADDEYVEKKEFLQSAIISANGAIIFAKRFSDLAKEMAQKEVNADRRAELMKISEVCANVPANPAKNFYEACQSFWFVHAILQIESNGHSISPVRFDQYMYPFLKNDIKTGKINYAFAQELIDCIFLKLNEVNKIRDEASTKAFGGYPMFQNLIVGGQTMTGEDATNELSFMCLEATKHTKMAQPSISVRVHENTPEALMLKAAEITALGIGMPAYYNDEVIIPALVKRGVSLEDAKDYGIIGCVEPQKGGKTDGWHDSGFFNLARAFEITLNNGMSDGVRVGIETGKFEDFKDIDEVINAYQKQMEYFVYLLASAENSVDKAHAKLGNTPFLSTLVDDCIKKGKSLQNGGAVYNFTGPQGVGVANVADSLEAIKTIVYDKKLISSHELKLVLDNNFGNLNDIEKAMVQAEVYKALRKMGIITDKINDKALSELNTYELKPNLNGEYVRQMLINTADKYGNDIEDVDMLARKVALIYCEEVEKYKNPRGGIFQPGLYPASINVAMGMATGATPDGRKSGTPLADGVSPTAGMDKLGPTAVMNSVAKLDHIIASNGTLLNLKFHPAILQGEDGYKKLSYLIRGYFKQKGMHVQFNVISRETLIEAQKNPEEYKNLVVRVAGYSAQFTALDKSIQDDIINRTEQEI